MNEKKLYRIKEDSILAGVCTGLAEYFNIDTVLVRLIFIILMLLNGIGFMLYFVLWLIIPLQGRFYETEDIMKENLNEMKVKVKQLGTSVKGSSKSTGLIGILLVGMGLIFMLREFFPQISFAIGWPLVMIIAGAYLLFRQ